MEIGINELASRWGVSKPTAYRRVKGITRIQKGNRAYFREEDVTNIQKQEVKPDFREYGVSATPRWGSSITEEKLRELRGREGRVLLHEMATNDPVIAATFFAIENLIRGVSWRVKPVSESLDDIEAAGFLETAFGDMSFSWSDTLQFVLGMLEQGFTVLEICVKRRLGPDPKSYTPDPSSSQYDDGRIGWRKWAPRPVDSLTVGKEWEFDEHGGIKGINQTATSQMESKFIPIEKLLLFRTTVAPSNSPEGRPIHRAAFVPWHYSNSLQEIEGIGIERDLAGLPVVYLGRGTRLHGSDNAMDQAKQIVVNLRNDEQAGVVFPYPKLGTGAEGEGVLLELLASAGRRTYDTSKIIERYDKRKAVSMLSMFIMLGMDQVGSFALSKSQGDLFSIAVSGWLKSISDVINRFAIPRLFSYNVFPKIKRLPQWVPSDVGLPNLEDLATYVNQLALARVITPDAELERHLRHIAHLPAPQPVVPGTTPEVPQDTTAAQTLMREQMLTASRGYTNAQRINRLIQDGLVDAVRGQQLIDENMRMADTAVGGLSDDSDGSQPVGA